jgi:GNAT superfamily N-acetyltransferase
MRQALATAGEAAGRGAGRALMAAAGGWACGYGCALITLEGVLASGTIVRGVCRRLGYAGQALKLAEKALSPGAARRRNRTPLAALPGAAAEPAVLCDWPRLRDSRARRADVTAARGRHAFPTCVGYEA